MLKLSIRNHTKYPLLFFYSLKKDSIVRRRGDRGFSRYITTVPPFKICDSRISGRDRDLYVAQINLSLGRYRVPELYSTEPKKMYVDRANTLR